MDAITPPEERSTRRTPLLAGLLGLAALVLAGYIATQVIGVLYGIIAPPLPPVPDDVREINYTSIGYGVDEWLYSLAQSPCDLAAYYEAQGGTCRIMPYKCTGISQPGDATSPTPLVARCGGSIRFSIFVMDWRAFLSEEGDGTKLELAREVNWIGGAPRPLPEETNEPN